jgi:hypothetical protein
MSTRFPASADRQHRTEDYLETVGKTVPSFHFRTGKVPWLPVTVAPSEPTSSWGYPQPGIQSPTPALATAKHYFVDDGTWARILDHGEFDDVVVGSGFCALAYVEAALKHDPWRKILILERGGVYSAVYIVESSTNKYAQVSGYPNISRSVLSSIMIAWLIELTFLFKNMPLPFKLVLGGPSETFPFTLTSQTARSEDKVHALQDMSNIVSS